MNFCLLFSIEMASHANKVFTPTVQNCVNISSFVLCPVCCPSLNPVLLEFYFLPKWNSSFPLLSGFGCRVRHQAP